MGSRKRKTRQSWNPESMIKAIEAVKQYGMSYGKAGILFNVNKTTLQRRCKGKNKIANDSVKLLGSKISVMPKEMEEELFHYCLTMEERLFGLTTDDIREMAYELAERNGIQHPFNSKTRKAGWAWFSGFRRRYPRLSLRSPENTSAARARGFNQQNVKSFFDLYETVMADKNFPPHRIYNVDEKGVSTVPNHVPKVIARRGRKQVGTMASGEKGQTTTTVICGNAMGQFVPPLFIFPRVKQNHDLMRGAPEGSIQRNCKTGWIQKEIFIEWLKHFIAFTATTKENPSLLILDGHSTHTKSLELIDLARESGVTIMCLPPHTTHRMQPLDVAVMKPLSVGLSKASKKWLGDNVGQVIGLYQIAEIFASGYEKACVPSHLINGFAKCGLYPINADIFQGKFAAAATTDIPFEDDEPETPSHTPHLATGTPTHAQDPAENLLEISTSTISPSDIRPIPLVDQVIEKSKRSGKQKKSGKAAILTSSPYMKELTKDQQIEKLKMELKETKQALRSMRKRSGRKLFESEKKNIILNKKKLKKEKKKKKIDGPDGKEPPLLLVPSHDLSVGQFILVSFSGDDQPSSSKERKPVFYVGWIVRMVDDDKVETKFLRRSDLKKTSTMKFVYPNEVDQTIHSIDRIELVLPRPLQVTGKSVRLGSFLTFAEPKLNNYSPVL